MQDGEQERGGTRSGVGCASSQAWLAQRTLLTQVGAVRGSEGMSEPDFKVCMLSNVVAKELTCTAGCSISGLAGRLLTSPKTSHQTTAHAMHEATVRIRGNDRQVVLLY